MHGMMFNSPMREASSMKGTSVLTLVKEDVSTTDIAPLNSFLAKTLCISWNKF